MPSLEKNFQLAQEASDYVLKTVSLGASNKPRQKDVIGNEKTHMGLNVSKALELNRAVTEMGTSLILGALGLFSEMLNTYKNQNIIFSTLGLQTTYLATRIFKAGNCQEQATVAYKFLSNKGIYPLEICRIEGGNHVFVIIGRNQNSNIKDPSTWGKNTVICDPWSKNYHATDYKQWLKQMGKSPELIKNLAVIQSRQPSPLSYLISSSIESASVLLLKDSLRTFLANGNFNLSGKSLFVISMGLTNMLCSIKQYNQSESKCDDELNRQLPHP